MDDTLPGSVTNTAYDAYEPPTTIDDLPADVLMLIFSDVFDSLRRPVILPGSRDWDDIRLDPWPKRRLLYDDLQNDSPNPEHPAPECLAAVCPKWREAMSNMSIFWTHFAIWTGRDATPLSRIRQYLAWSRDHLLDIYILRRYDPFLEDPAERDQVRAIFDLLLPHVGRWHILCVKVLYSSSLPIPHVDLVGRAAHLVRLNLDFMIDDLAAVIATDSPLTGKLDTPVLERLTMGGVHFRESYVRAFQSSSQSPMPPKVMSFVLTGYDAHNEPFPLVDLLTCLLSCKRLYSIQLDSLQLDTSYTGPSVLRLTRNPPFTFWHIETAHFVNMSGDVIAEYNRLLDYPYSESIEYTRCTMPDYRPGPHGEIPTVAESYNVELTGIPDSSALLYYLSPLPGGASCRQATITNCDGLTPALLCMLGEPVVCGTDGAKDVWMCADLTDLVITGCTRFSSGDLRAALEGRRNAHVATDLAEEDDDDFVLMSVTDLRVCDCGELALEDKEWFNKNVEIVQWDDWTGGTRQTLF